MFSEGLFRTNHLNKCGVTNGSYVFKVPENDSISHHGPKKAAGGSCTLPGRKMETRKRGISRATTSGRKADSKRHSEAAQAGEEHCYLKEKKVYLNLTFVSMCELYPNSIIVSDFSCNLLPYFIPFYIMSSYEQPQVHCEMRYI